MNPLWIGGSLGVLLSGAFVYWQVGRFASPQVPQTLFDERREIIAYTVGLFGGIVLSIPFGLFFTSLTEGPLLWSLVGLAGLVLGLELAQWLLLRSHYFGEGESGPFYAVGFRAGASAILVLTLTTLYLGGPTIDPAGVVALLVQSAAIVSLATTGALLSVGLPRPGGGRSGGPVSSGVVSAAGFFFLGFAGLFGPVVAAVAAALILGVAARSYLRLRDPILGAVRPPGAPERPTTASATSFGRLDR